MCELLLVESRDDNHPQERVVQLHQRASASEAWVLAHAHGNGEEQQRLGKLLCLHLDAAHCNLILGRWVRRKPNAVWTVGQHNSLQERHAFSAHQPLPSLPAPHRTQNPRVSPRGQIARCMRGRAASASRHGRVQTAQSPSAGISDTEGRTWLWDRFKLSKIFIATCMLSCHAMPRPNQNRTARLRRRATSRCTGAGGATLNGPPNG